jgi:hypothetical protein
VKGNFFAGPEFFLSGTLSSKKEDPMFRKILAAVGIGLIATGCTAMDPQGAARQQAETYYGRSYDQLSGQEKMRLEDHLARQSNQAWNTTAHVASGVGRLLQGVGVLVLSAKH